MRISDWSSDVCSSDLLDALDVEQLRIERTLVAEEHIVRVDGNRAFVQARRKRIALNAAQVEAWRCIFAPFRRDVEAGHLRCNRRQIGEIEFLYRLGAERRDRGRHVDQRRSEEHTSELQSLMRISYAVFCLTKKNNTRQLSNH